jgi:Flp pilus assembly protein TadG
VATGRCASVYTPRVTNRPTRRHTRGQAFVETAIAVLLLVMCTATIIDFGRFFWSLLTVQNGVTMGTRFAVTNQLFSGLDRDGSIRKAIRDATPGFELADSDIAFYNVSKGGPGSGGPRDTIRVTVEQDFQFLTPVVADLFGDRGTIRFRASSTMQNEPKDEEF